VLRDHLLDQVCDRPRIANVAADEGGRVPGSRGRLCRRLPSTNDHPGAAFEERLGDSPADTPRASGHDHDRSVEPRTWIFLFHEK
jgi:hypothetical protein